MDIRIGYGEDIHALKCGRRLVIGGVTIPYEKGLDGHSDADILFHALSDALLGSLALGDIGKLFPPSDPKTYGIDSEIILSECHRLVEEKGYMVVNVDASISAEEPRLSPYIQKMRENISRIMGIDVSSVSVKAMTNEGFDAVGKKEAMKAVVAILVKKEDKE